MDFDTITGCLTILASIGTIVGLVIWSRRSINRISRRGYGTAREIIKGMDK